jgi:large subunit ribosomal protein L29
MKPNEIRDMNDDALVAKGLELREQLFRLRFKHALGNTDVVKSIKDARKDFARVKNELQTRELRAAEEAGTARKRFKTRADRKKAAARRMRAGSRV